MPFFRTRGASRRLALSVAVLLCAGSGAVACLVSIDESLWKEAPKDRSAEARRLDSSVRDSRADLPDAFRVPDGGCPAGYAQCGTACAQLPSDLEHCGACDNACSPDTSDGCKGGTCRCGGQAPCEGSLNCVAGSCQCVSGGLCDGCCEGKTCVPIGPTQSASKCGEQGEPCRICNDGGNSCTDDVCLAGKCEFPPLTDGQPCEAGFCTVNGLCQAGTCVGTKRDCSDVADACNNGICDETAGQCEKKSRPGGTPCDLDDLFCTRDACHSGTCVAEAPRDCSNLDDPCNTGVCSETAKQCEKQLKPDGDTCNDGNACTDNDQCTGGVCGGTAKPDGTDCGMGSCCAGQCCGFMTQCCPDKTCKMFCS